ncbi:MAG: hypothetical protein CVU46_17295 [Chloroflexi bacterium HGW-Chloroflexi-8]|jgi:hypothetical protein|nr:MAG: hypothetical protein CVU46_17295 [Chloroflexi bacterium HGW-Chloroflexi-8]
MVQKTYYGNFTPEDFTRSIIAQFHRGNLHVQQIGDGEKVVVQIATKDMSQSGGKTAIGISLQKVEDGVMVQVGKQVWFSIAASLGLSAISLLRNPLNILGRMDDIAQDIENLQLRDEIWDVIENTAKNLGSGFELSERIRRYVCDFCNTPNPIGQPDCIACGAPLGSIQPITCKNCGYVVTRDEKICPNCKKIIS